VQPLPPLALAKRTDLAATDHQQRLGQALEQSVAALPQEEQWVSFLSGGIDSSTAAALVRRRSTRPVWAVSLGTSLGNEFDQAQASADELGIDLRRIICNETELRASFEEVIWDNEVIDGLTAEILAQLNLMVRFIRAEAGPGTRVVTGYGADYLLGGMLQHALYMMATGASEERDLIERTHWTGEFAPFYAWRKSIPLHHLYWHPTMISAGLQTPLEHNERDGYQKHLLRTLAVEKGWLSRARSFTRKLALTEGTHAHIVLSRALGLGDSYNPVEKNAFAINLMREKLATVGRERAV
jgi:asparagine synthetase B (glutamine-hydrolysing)